PPRQGEAMLVIRLEGGAPISGKFQFTIRATALQRGNPPTLSETAGASPMDGDTLAVLRTGFLPVLAETQVPLEIIAAE
ncbi:MAG TPA: hypothetical protein VL475_07745, partial [Planctomycetaceae bacterium]|nr:hypothetical protein [Planctomycetaceae bacterium]